MTTTFSTRTTSPSTITSSSFARTPVSVVAFIAGVVGAVVIFGYAALAHAISVPMHAGNATIAPSDFSGGVITCTIPGALLAVALAHWAKRPAQTFVRSTIALTGVSLVFPFIASDTEMSTRLTLALAHVVAAAIVIPLITRRLALVRKPAAS